MSDFQADLLLYNTSDGAEIVIDENNFFVNETGFDTAIYLSLFGGNQDDNGTESTKKFEYWANKIESNPDYKLTGRFKTIIRGLPLTLNNLNRAKEAAKLDLAWMINMSIIDTLNITMTIPEKNRVNMTIEGIKDKKLIINTRYEVNWLSNAL